MSACRSAACVWQWAQGRHAGQAEAPEGARNEGAIAPSHDVQVQRVQHLRGVVVGEVQMHLAALLVRVHVVEPAPARLACMWVTHPWGCARPCGPPRLQPSTGFPA